MSYDRRGPRHFLLAVAGILSLVETPSGHATGAAGITGFSEPAYRPLGSDGITVLYDSSSIGTSSWSDDESMPDIAAVSAPLLSGSLEFSQDSYPTTRGDGALVVTVNRVQGSSGPVIATYTTRDGSALSGQDYTTTSGTLNWADGDSSPKTFLVPISSQAVAGHTFSLSLLTALGAAFGDNTNAAANIVIEPTITASRPAPAAEADTTALTDLGGYDICVSGTGSASDGTIQIADPVTASMTIGHASAGTYYYLTGAAYDSTGAISSPASAVSTLIQ
jgi:hypothetical protein